MTLFFSAIKSPVHHCAALVYETLKHRNIGSNDKFHIVRRPLEEGRKNTGVQRTSTYRKPIEPTRLIGRIRVTDSRLHDKEVKSIHLPSFTLYCTYEISV
jgi:hypothetical protein